MILVDAHVHIYDCFDLETFLDSAYDNFRAEAIRIGQVEGFSAVLLLTETETDNWFQRLARHARNEQLVGTRNGGGWTFYHTKETCSLITQTDVGEELYVIAGRQIVTEEGLEVLALMTEKAFEDGCPLIEVIEAVKRSDAIPVIPWGFGKWSGLRGRILKEKLENSNDSELFLGDNCGRPSILPRPSYFKLAESRGIGILPGSDPLPFSSEILKVGSFGFSVIDHISLEKPATDLKNILLNPTTNPAAYGRPETFYCFLRNQLKIRFRKPKPSLTT